LNRRTLKLIGVLLFATIALQEAGFWLSYYGAYQLGFRQPQPVQELVSKAGYTELPFVLSDGHDYLETEHYATPEWKQRLVFVEDYRGALAHGRSDYNDKQLLALRTLAPLRVIEYPPSRIVRVSSCCIPIQRTITTPTGLFFDCSKIAGHCKASYRWS